MIFEQTTAAQRDNTIIIEQVIQFQQKKFNSQQWICGVATTIVKVQTLDALYQGPKHKQKKLGSWKFCESNLMEARFDFLPFFQNNDNTFKQLLLAFWNKASQLTTFSA